MSLFRKTFTLILTFGVLVALVAGFVTQGPSASRPLQGDEPAASRGIRHGGLDDAPPEVRAFLGRVLAELPPGGAGITDFQFRHWEQTDKPTREAIGIKPTPGTDPDALIARVLDVDRYEGQIPHVEACRSLPAAPADAPGSVRLYQRVSVPGVARVQHVLQLVDAGTIQGYRVAYWHLLGPETDALDPRLGARGESNIGAWFAAPGVVGYALSTWPRRSDVNALQWFTLTTAADGVANQVIERNIDVMAELAKPSPKKSPGTDHAIEKNP